MSSELGPPPVTEPEEEKLADALRRTLYAEKERLENYEAEWEEAVQEGHSDGKIVSLSRRIVQKRNFLNWLNATLTNNGVKV